MIVRSALAVALVASFVLSHGSSAIAKDPMKDYYKQQKKQHKAYEKYERKSYKEWRKHGRDYGHGGFYR